MTSTPSNKPITITIKLTDVKFLSFHETEAAKENTELIPNDGYEFDFSFELNLDAIKQMANFTLKTTLFKKASPRMELAVLKSLVSVSILNYSETITLNEEGKFLLPDKLIEIGSSVAVGNARGMFAIKLQNSIYANAIIPLIDPRSFIQKNPV